MEPKPVKAGRSPAFPTRRELLAGAASLALVNLTGLRLLFAKAEQETLSVAPIFEHGAGRGATGCVVVSPPVFLSEEEGMQIIREELSRHGIQLREGILLEGVRIPQRMLVDEPEIEGKASSAQVVESRIHPKPLRLDGIDPDKRVAVEFVSEKDYFDLGGVQQSYDLSELKEVDVEKGDQRSAISGFVMSTAQDYDFKETAGFVAAQVRKQGAGTVYLGVLYDPLGEIPNMRGAANVNAAWRAFIEASEKPPESRKDDSKKLLRQQVAGFAAWSKEKGVIQ